MSSTISTLSKHLLSATKTPTTRHPFFRHLKGWVYGKKRGHPQTIRWENSFKIQPHHPDTYPTQASSSLPLKTQLLHLKLGKLPYFVSTSEEGGYNLYVRSTQHVQDPIILCRHFNCHKRGLENCNGAILPDFSAFLQHTLRNPYMAEKV